MRERARRGVRPIGLAVAALSFLISILAVELVLRAAEYTRHLGDPPNALMPWVAYDPVLGRTNIAGYAEAERDIYVNSMGFRGGEVRVPKPPGTIRIVCLGDSTTFGLFLRAPIDLRLDASYPVELARALRESGRDHVEVVNAGVLGYTTSAALVLLHAKVAALSPDVLIVRLGNNDHTRNLGEAPQLSTDLEYAVVRHLPTALFESELVRLGFHAYRRALARTSLARRGDKVPPDLFERNLRRLVADAKRMGARLAFLDSPYRDAALGPSPGETFPNFLLNVPTFEDLHRLHDAYQDTIARVSRETGTPFVRTAPALRASPDPPFSLHDLGHPNEVGARIIAQRVFEELRDLGWLDPGGRR